MSTLTLASKMEKLFMEYVKFVVHENPYVCWDWELKKKNLEFLEGIDPEYYTISFTVLVQLISFWYTVYFKFYNSVRKESVSKARF